MGEYRIRSLASSGTVRKRVLSGSGIMGFVWGKAKAYFGVAETTA